MKGVVFMEILHNFSEFITLMFETRVSFKRRQLDFSDIILA